jgi:hypothetical protein
MQRLGVVRAALREFGIRDAVDYAEVLIAEVLGGKRATSRVTQGHDVIAARYGRIEVKCRQLPADGRIEERVQVSASKESGFDFLAILVFRADFTVKGAAILPYSAVWDLAVHQHYNRISYAQASRLPGAVDITDAVRGAAAL